MKRMISLILSVAMLLSVTAGINLTALAGGGEPVYSLDEDGRALVKIEEPNQVAQLWFHPEETGDYCFYSYSDQGKTIAWLYNVPDDIPMATGSPFNGEANAICVHLKAGEVYRLDCRFQNSYQTGKFRVEVARNGVKSIRYVQKAVPQIKEFTNGSYQYDSSGKKFYMYFYYNEDTDAMALFHTGDKLLVTYNNNTTDTFTVKTKTDENDISYYVLEDQNGYPLPGWPDCSGVLLEQFNSHWKVGRHNVTLTWHGRSWAIAVDIVAKGWEKKNGKWYFSKNGAYLKGWQKIDGKWYYLDKSTGAMKVGWLKDGGKWYYLGSSGAMLTGWQKIGGVWYYFNSSGAMLTGWQKIGGKWYYFESSGAIKTGWLKDGGKWYYLDTSGAMLANTSKKIGGKTYKFNASGVCTNP